MTGSDGNRLSISVVTPSFNMARYLEDTMDSVLVNLQPGDQYMVVDGGSTDGSQAIIRDKASRLSWWTSEPDNGYAHALAKGFRHCTGEILCWINVGDRLAAGALDVARDAICESGADMIFGDDFYIDEEGRVLALSRGYVSNLRHAMLFGGWTPLQDAVFWRRSIFEAVGGIDPVLQFAADYDLFLRVALTGKVEYVPSVFSAFRRHAGQKSISGAAAYRREREMVRKRELAKLGGHPMAKAMLRAWYALSIRWRVHIAQRRWRRPDLHGIPMKELRCGAYWPGSDVRP